MVDAGETLPAVVGEWRTTNVQLWKGRSVAATPTRTLQRIHKHDERIRIVLQQPCGDLSDQERRWLNEALLRTMGDIQHELTKRSAMGVEL